VTVETVETVETAQDSVTVVAVNSRDVVTAETAGRC
jgi:hypothetical protein